MRCVTPECGESEVRLNCTCVPRQSKVKLNRKNILQHENLIKKIIIKSSFLSPVVLKKVNQFTIVFIIFNKTIIFDLKKDVIFF